MVPEKLHWLPDVAPIHGGLRLIQERGSVVVSDVDRYVIIGKFAGFYFESTSGSHTSARNSDMLTPDFSP
jgi:hypothetical protein